MARYIDTLELLWLYDHECEKYSGLEELVADVPTADVRENVHGRWVENGAYLGKLRFKCSACQEDMAVSTVMLKPIWNYCPKCGADMRGDDDAEIH